MRTIPSKLITEKITKAFWEINCILPNDVQSLIKKSLKTEKSQQGKNVLNQLLLNTQLAKQKKMPICQDTGLAIVNLEIGQEIKITGDLQQAIEKGVKAAYQNLRKSTVVDPLLRTPLKDNTPAIIHTEIIPGNKLKIHLMAKGGGAENKSAIKMFNPTTNLNEIKNFIIETVKNADASACPPMLVGVGIGGTFDYCAYLAKKALFRPLKQKHKNKFYQKLEQALLTEINQLGIGPAGYGGNTTALAVQIENYPCHIASLPVAVNIQCHAARSCSIIL